MNVTFWGVRGSIPSPGPDTVRYGGNTACVSVEIGDRVLVLDAGTGIRRLGSVLARRRAEIVVLLSHLHVDHIIGLPFFEPLYQPGQTVYLLDHQHGGRSRSLLELFDSEYSPVKDEYLQADHRRVNDDVMAFLRQLGLDVARIDANHPGGAFGYRIEHERRVVVYMPDNELNAPRAGTSFAQFVSFCRGADVLIHDAQYRPDEIEGRRGWGHSDIDDACRLAAAARVAHLVFFHHDPARTDTELDAVEAHARQQLHEDGIPCTAAREGLELVL